MASRHTLQDRLDNLLLSVVKQFPGSSTQGVLKRSGRSVGRFSAVKRRLEVLEQQGYVSSEEQNIDGRLYARRWYSKEDKP